MSIIKCYSSFPDLLLVRKFFPGNNKTKVQQINHQNIKMNYWKHKKNFYYMSVFFLCDDQSCCIYYKLKCDFFFLFFQWIKNQHVKDVLTRLSFHLLVELLWQFYLREHLQSKKVTHIYSCNTTLVITHYKNAEMISRVLFFTSDDIPHLSNHWSIYQNKATSSLVRRKA